MILTIVVPVYNFARFIPKLMQSVVSQTTVFDQLSVLFVDDGSSDNTKDVVNEYIKKYPNNVSYYRKENGNWGSVINFVRKNKLIKTPYMTVCDADDWYATNSLSKIWKDLDGTNDLVIANFLKKRRSGYLPIFVYWTLRKKIPNEELKKQTPFCIPLGKFVRTEVFYQLPHLKEKTFYQDAIYTANLIKLANKIIYCKHFVGIYFYANQSNSMSRPWDQSRFRAELDVMNDLIDTNCQEVASVHLLRKSFRKLVRQNKITFKVPRKFKFKLVTVYLRWLFVLVYFFSVRKYFKVIPSNQN